MTATLAKAIEHAQYQLTRCPPCDEGDQSKQCSHPIGDPREVIAELLPGVLKLAEVRRLLESAVPTSVAVQVLAEIRDILTEDDPS